MPVRKYLKESIKLGDKELTVETGRVAKQADGSVVIRYGDTMVLVAAVAANSPREGIDFFPLTVEYRESNYAAGRIPGNYFRREGRPNEKETLTCRLIDRPCRPLFTEGFRNETQVIATVISADPDNDPDVIAITGASLRALPLRHPFPDPDCGRPHRAHRRALHHQPDLRRAQGVAPEPDRRGHGRGHRDGRGGRAGSLRRDHGRGTDARAQGDQSTLPLAEGALQGSRHSEARGRGPRRSTKRCSAKSSAITPNGCAPSLDTSGQDKRTSYAAVDALKKEVVESYPEDLPEKRQMAKKIFDHLKENIFRDDILNKRRRPDGRRFSEIRPITCEVGWLPRAHGSALFTRGETQALVTTTLGTKDDEQFMDDLEKGEIKRRFLLHYNFPHYSVGEVGRFGSSSRREIGHGALARRAIEARPARKSPISLTRSASSRTSPSRTAHLRWPRSAAASSP